MVSFSEVMMASLTMTRRPWGEEWKAGAKEEIDLANETLRSHLPVVPTKLISPQANLVPIHGTIVNKGRALREEVSNRVVSNILLKSCINKIN